MKLSEIAGFLKGELAGDGDIEITGLAKIENAGPGELTFLANPKYAKYLEETKASAVLVNRSMENVPLNHIRLDDPYIGFLFLLEKFSPEPETGFTGIHSSAQIAGSAVIGKNAAIGANVYVGENAVIGDNTIIHPNATIYPDVKIGTNCVIHSNVSIRQECVIGNRVILHNGTVIGSDGFGFAPDGDKYRKIPQRGIVRIEDDAELGANCSIDRATLGETVIGAGCKLDNLVQVAHNVVIGPDTVIAAQTGVAGSTRIGTHVTIAGQVGVTGHIQVGDNAIIAAQSGVSKSVPAGEVWFGYPAMPINKMKKIEVSMRHLPDLSRKIHQLEKQIISLEEKLKAREKGNE
jgi:UDP-3-O-[3-hydroxymyristoyl] glucosamine N-acyltransferase